MSLIKSLLFGVLILVVLAGAGLVAFNRGMLDNTFLNTEAIGAFSNLDWGDITTSWEYFGDNSNESASDSASPPLIASAKDQSLILASRAGELNTQAQQILGSFIEVNEAEEEKNLSEKAFEYGRYLYCQQVVNDWERSQTANNSDQN